MIAEPPVCILVKKMRLERDSFPADCWQNSANLREDLVLEDTTQRISEAFSRSDDTNQRISEAFLRSDDTNQRISEAFLRSDDTNQRISEAVFLSDETNR